MNEGRIEDDEIKDAIVKRPYRKWLDDNLLHLNHIPIIQRPLRI
jgi:glutamate synthase (ferredoxin)